MSISSDLSLISDMTKRLSLITAVAPRGKVSYELYLSLCHLFDQISEIEVRLTDLAFDGQVSFSGEEDGAPRNILVRKLLAVHGELTVSEISRNSLHGEL